MLYSKRYIGPAMTLFAYALPMGGKTDIEVRRRLVEWARYLIGEYNLTQTAFAKKVGIAQPTMSAALKGEKTLGLDFLVKLHRAFGRSADLFLDSEPPWEGQGRTSSASREPASPAGRRREGGHG